MKETSNRPRQKEVLKARKQPSLREVRGVLRGPAKELTKQINILKGVRDLKYAPGTKEQTNAVVKLAKRLKGLAAKQIRGRLRNDLNNSGVLGMRFSLKNPSYSPKSKGRVIYIIKGLGGGIKYRNNRKGVTISGTVRKGPGGRTPVDVSVKGKLRIPEQPQSTIHFAYNHANRRFTVGGIYRLKQAGTLAGKTAQLDIRGKIGVSPTETTYKGEVAYGNRNAQVKLFTTVAYQNGKASWVVGGGAQFRF